MIGTLGISKTSPASSSERKLRALSITDNLTGLYNQRLFPRISQAQRAPAANLDDPHRPDGFKAVNDRDGHGR